MSDLAGRFGRSSRTRAATGSSGSPRLRDSFGSTWFWWLVLAVAVLYPMISNTTYIFFVAGGVGIYSIVGIGMNLLYGLGGQVSLGQGAIVAVGAYVAGGLIVHRGWGMWPALIVGLLAGAVTGIVMGLPSLRLSTWYFALTTLAFGGVVVGLVNHFRGLTGGADGLVGIVVPMSSKQLFYLVVAINAVGLVLYRTFAQSRLGRGLIAIKEGGEAGTVSGVRATYIKLIAFGISGAYAGVGGALFAFEQQVISPDQFTTYFSIFFIVIIVAGGLGRWLGPVIGALAFFAIPEFLTSLAEWRMVIYGVALLAFMAFAPEGIMGAVETAWRRVRRRSSAAEPAARADLALDPEAVVSDSAARIAALLKRRAAPDGNPSSGALVVDGVAVAFGGVKALQGVSLQLEPGRVYGLVGPNGSGKTTLLNVITGIYVPSSGTVSLDETTLTGIAPAKLAKLGIGRTFQTPRLLKDLSAWENVMLGSYSGEKATAAEVLARLPRNRRESKVLGQRANDLLEALGLADRAGARAGDLPHGHQRMIEIARALMVEPRLLLLDEPAAGLSADELEVLDRLVRNLGGGGVTVLVVEHHIGWVREVCTHVTVLDQGTVVTSGDPEAVFSDRRVRETYLGVSA